MTTNTTTAFRAACVREALKHAPTGHHVIATTKL